MNNAKIKIDKLDELLSVLSRWIVDPRWIVYPVSIITIAVIVRFTTMTIATIFGVMGNVLLDPRATLIEVGLICLVSCVSLITGQAKLTALAATALVIGACVLSFAQTHFQAALDWRELVVVSTAIGQVWLNWYAIERLVNDEKKRSLQSV